MADGFVGTARVCFARRRERDGQTCEEGWQKNENASQGSTRNRVRSEREGAFFVPDRWCVQMNADEGLRVKLATLGPIQAIFVVKVATFGALGGQSRSAAA